MPLLHHDDLTLYHIRLRIAHLIWKCQKGFAYLECRPQRVSESRIIGITLNVISSSQVRGTRSILAGISMVRFGQCGNRPQFRKALCIFVISSGFEHFQLLVWWCPPRLVTVSLCLHAFTIWRCPSLLSQWPSRSGTQRVLGLGRVWWVLLQRILVNKTGQQDHAAVCMSVKLQD